MLARLLKAGEAAELVGYFVASGVGATGLTVTVDVWRRQPAGNWTEIVTAASATQIGDGGYEYQLAGANVTAGASYFYVFKTAGTADQQHVAGYCACETDYTSARAAYLDAAITSRADATHYTATRAGYLDTVNTNLDATISSRLASSAVVARSSTATAGAASTITLDGSASSTDDIYNGHIVVITGGTGAGQARLISDYVGSTKVATVSRSWTTNPASGSTFALLALDGLGTMSTTPSLYSSGTLGYLIGTIGDGNFTVVQATSDAGDVTLYQGDDYSGTNAGITLSITNDRSLTITSARIETAKDSITLTVVAGSGSTLSLKIAANSTATNALTLGQREMRVIGVNTDGDHTLAVGTLTVKAALQ